MFKIGTKIYQGIKRYGTKNTVRAKYYRSADGALGAGLAAGIQILRMPHWDINDIGITAFLGTIAAGSLRRAVKNFIALQPIKNRALQIKKASKVLNKKA